MTSEPMDILIVDDDELFRDELLHLISPEGHAVRAVGSIAEARPALKAGEPAVVLLDIQLPDGNGLAFLREITAAEPHPEVVMVSGAASMQEAADSVKTGAADFLEKPFEPQRLLSILNRSLEIARLKAANRRLIEDRLAPYRLIGDSEAMQRLRGQIRQVAATDARVLITGESGTGKELVAGQIHYRSRRSGAPFVKVNCAAIPSELVESELFGHEAGAFTGAVKAREGRFALADGGSLLLDEIGDMPANSQPTLLRVLETGEIEPLGAVQTRKIDVRLITSTNQDLGHRVEEGRFRGDLLYRINTVPIALPPLRQHPEDIPLLVNHFLDQLPEPKRLDGGALGRLCAHRWPGNVRELRNAIERLTYTTSGETISAEAVEGCLRESPGEAATSGSAAGANRLATAVAEYECRFLAGELRGCDGNITRLARKLEMDRGNLYRKLKKLGLLSE